MCWGVEVSAGFAVLGAGAAVLSARRGDPVALPATLAYFALMEGLQTAGYLVIDQCGTPANRVIAQLSILHIALQPIIINAFILALVRPHASARLWRGAMTVATLSSAVIVVQLLPIPGFGPCDPAVALCGEAWCTRSGDWHLAWEAPYNGLMVPLERTLHSGMAFPTYVLAVFMVPVLYGAWRFALFHLLVGPVLAFSLTTDPDEAPAIWCLSAILIILVTLAPPVRRLLAPARVERG